MKAATLSILLLGVVSCATTKHADDNKEHSDLTTTQAEKCKSCGTIHRYSATFDRMDYSLIADFCDAFSLKRQAFWKAPHGPTPACSSNYDSDLCWDYLHEQMPELRRDTYDSFKRRNSPIPTHLGNEDLAAEYGITIVQGSTYAYRLSRAGFSGKQQQALIYSGSGVIHLFQRKDNKWQQIDSCVLWIS
ncbi:hypothetical protein ACFSW8_04280 [Rubritalea tangerina]|uniref:DUF4440 domain-containing protein n=2 Tax=Rubritalea tangerina TaxID=430798 RepID=A0ABW4Z800_9BACT